MSVGKLLDEQLRLLARAGHDAAQLQPLSDDTRSLSVGDTQTDAVATLELFDYDRYSVALRSLQVENIHWTEPGAQQAPAATQVRALLSARAAEVIRRLSYLEEPLGVLELDGDQQVVQVRSLPPQCEGADRFFWEVTLWVGAQSGARIARYHWAPGMIEREIMPYPVAFALVGRIADSLADALQVSVE